MIPIPDIGHVYPKGDVDLRFDTTPRFVSTGSYFFDGINDHIELNGLTWTSNGAAWSISFWTKTTQTSDGRWFEINNNGNGEDVNIQILSSNLKIYTNGTGGAGVVTGVSGTDYADGVWHHFCLTVSSGTTGKFYIDGAERGSFTLTGDIDMSNTSGTPDSSTKLGASHGTGGFIAMNMAHFAIWHKTLSQAEIRSLMEATTYAEAVTKGGATPRCYFELQANATDSVGAITYATSGNANGTASGAAAVGDRARLPNGYDLSMTDGVPNQMSAQLFSGRAVDFDGTGGSVNDELVADAYADSSTAFSVSCWIKATNYSANRGVATNGTQAEDVEHFLIWSQAGVFRYHYTDGTASYQVSTDYIPTAGEWFHYAATVDGSTASAYDAKVYIDGKLQTTAKSTTGATWYADDGLSVGSQYGHAAYWDGSIADVRMFNVELTAAQVLELYQVPEQVLPTGVASSALKRFYPLSDYDVSGAESLAGLYLQDCSGNGKHLLSSGCAMEFSQSGIPQMGLRSSSSRIYFGGASSGDYCESSDTDLVTNTFSFSIWVNAFSNAGSYQSIISGADTGNDYDEGITIDLGVASSSAVDHISVEGQGFTKADQYSGSIPFGQWFHLAFTSNASTYVTYINGSQVNSASRTNTTANKLDIIRLGARYYSSAVQAATQFDGLLTDCGVFNAVLDADSVAAIHAAGIGADIRSDISNYDQSSALQHFWKTDNPVTCIDLEGSDNLTVNGTPAMATVPEGTTEGLSTMGSLTTTRLGSFALNLDGTSYAALDDGGTKALNPVTAGWSMSVWFRMINLGNGNSTIIVDRDTGNDRWHLKVRDDASDTIQFNFGDGSGKTDIDGPAVTDNNWHHVGITLDYGNDIGRIFVDGAKHGSDVDISARTADCPADGILGVGGNAGADQKLQGAVAGLRIYNATLADNDIKSLYVSGLRIVNGDP